MKLPNLYKFKVGRRIGRKIIYGLYEAKDQTNGTEVLLKVLEKQIASKPDNIVRFLSSARMLKLLESPNVCTIYDYGSDQDHYFISTERMLDWEPLSDLIDKPESCSVPQLLEIFIKLGKTLRQAHLHGIMHGLLNPKNIYINAEGQIKIEDFGFSWAIEDVLNQNNKHSVYLAQYISPDFYNGKTPVDGRVDMYSMGAMMFHLLTGSPLYSGTSVTELQTKHLEADIPVDRLHDIDLKQDLTDTIVRALDRTSDRRFLNLKEFVDYLDKLKTHCSDEGSADEIEPIEAEEAEYLPQYSDKFFVEEDSLTAEPKAFYKSKGLAFTVMTLLIVISALFFGRDKIDLSFFNRGNQNGIDYIRSSSDATKVAGIAQEPQDVVNPDELIAAIEEEVKNLRLARSTQSVETESGSDLSGPTAVQPKPALSTATPDLKKVEPVKKSEPAPKKEEVKASTKKAVASTPTNKIESAPKTTKSVASKPAAKSTDIKKSVVKNSPPTKKALAALSLKAGAEADGAAVFVDHKFKGKIDSKGEMNISDLEVGQSYTLKVSKNGYKTITETFVANANSSVLNLDIQRKQDIFGTLVLDAAPAADSIYVDGKLYKGAMPLNLTLPWGEHRVRFVNAKLKKSWDEVVHLKVGQILRVRHDFAKTEFGKVAVALKNAANFGFGYVYIDGKLWDGTPNTTPIELDLPVGSHTIEVRRDGFSSIPRDIIVVVEKDDTKYVSFTFSKTNTTKTD